MIGRLLGSSSPSSGGLGGAELPLGWSICVSVFCVSVLSTRARAWLVRHNRDLEVKVGCYPRAGGELRK